MVSHPHEAGSGRESVAAPIFLEWFNIELASRCNLRCKWCSLDFDKPTVNMDEAQLGKALDELLSTGWTIGEIALHNGGEALMHPRLPAIFDVIAARRAGRESFPLISLLTNGVLMNERKAGQVLASGAVDLVRFSVDGGSAAAFEELRAPAKWSLVRDNIHRFVKINNAAARRVKTGVICMIAPGRPAELGWMEEEFRDVLLAVDSYELRHPHNWDGSKDLGLTPPPPASTLGVVPLNLLRKGRVLLHQARELVAPRPEDHQHPVCKFLEREMVLLPDGRVSVCCADLNARGVIGDIAHNSLREVFHSDQRAAMIDAFRRGRKASIPLCKDCAGYY
jgi:sulfatase maturation enzyme AslB (radical SAM superfamily)